MYQRIFVPIDSSEASDAVIEEASRLSRALQARMCLVKIIDTSQFAEDPLELVHELKLNEQQRLLDERRGEHRHYLAEHAESLKNAGVEAETMLVEKFGGKICDAIVKAAADWKADLIVMGTHGRGGLRHILMGSVAEGVIHHTQIPILLLHVTSEDE